MDNRTPHSKPSSSGPSASRIAAQNKKNSYTRVWCESQQCVQMVRQPYILDHLKWCEWVPFWSWQRRRLRCNFWRLRATHWRRPRKSLQNLVNSEPLNMVLKKRKQVRFYICHKGGCTFFGKSIRELNEHHVKLHKDVLCEVCNKSFKTPSSLKRHSYSHGELKFSCNQCNEAFAFQSE